MEEKKGTVIITHEQWCKGCGICYNMCPNEVLGRDEEGKVIVVNADACNECRICEEHCPDYCIKIGG